MFKVTLLSVVVSKGGIRFFGRRDVHFLGTSQIFFGKRPHLAFKSFNLFFGSGENTSTSRLELAPLPVFGIMKPVVSHTRICWMQMKRITKVLITAVRKEWEDNRSARQYLTLFKTFRKFLESCPYSRIRR